MREPIHSGKVSEEALSRSIAVSVIVIILCMICLVGTSWAWYSLSVESGSNEMVGANFDFTVTVTKTVTPAASEDGEDGETNGPAEPIVFAVEPDPEDGYYTVGSEGEDENAVYRVTLTKKNAENTTGKGFCLITVRGSDTEAGTAYYVTFPEEGPITLTIEGYHSLKFTPVMGTENGYDLPDWMEIVSEPAAVEFSQEEEDQIEDDPPDDEVTGEGGEGTKEPETPPTENPESAEQETPIETSEEQTVETPPENTPINPDTTEQEPQE